MYANPEAQTWATHVSVQFLFSRPFFPYTPMYCPPPHPLTGMLDSSEPAPVLLVCLVAISSPLFAPLPGWESNLCFWFSLTSPPLWLTPRVDFFSCRELITCRLGERNPISITLHHLCQYDEPWPWAHQDVIFISFHRLWLPLSSEILSFWRAMNGRCIKWYKLEGSYPTHKG